jgi:hypothetical protein
LLCEAADVDELSVTYPPKQSEKCTNSTVEIASATQILLWFESVLWLRNNEPFRHCEALQAVAHNVKHALKQSQQHVCVSLRLLQPRRCVKVLVRAVASQ